MEPWLASIVFYAYVYLVCEACRQILKRIEAPEDVKCFLNEVIGTVQVCAPIFDVGFVLDHYGLTGVFIEIFCLELLNAFTLNEAFSHPIIVAESWRSAEASSLQVGVRIAAEFLGAFLSFPLTRLFWLLKLTHDHAAKYSDGSNCEADLTVSVFWGLVLEAIATFFSRLVELKSVDLPKIDIAVNCAASSLITVLGIHLTGMYFNPIVATACTWNCHGHTRTGHVIVYWVGPVIGWFAANMANGLLPVSFKQIISEKKAE